jgi:hypothetical protein
MRIRRMMVLPVALAGVLLTPGLASAHTVGTPGTPQCFGERISHASSDHKLTPKERAANFEKFVLPEQPEAQALFGNSVSVREIQWFVRQNCSDNPIVPTEPAP